MATVACFRWGSWGESAIGVRDQGQDKQSLLRRSGRNRPCLLERFLCKHLRDKKKASPRLRAFDGKCGGKARREGVIEAKTRRVCCDAAENK